MLVDISVPRIVLSVTDPQQLLAEHSVPVTIPKSGREQGQHLHLILRTKCLSAAPDAKTGFISDLCLDGHRVFFYNEFQWRVAVSAGPLFYIAL